MCGICGIIRFDGQDVHESVLRCMNETMVLRGPDDSGMFIEGSFGMAMRRLSIIDLATGNQPISNEDGTIQVVLNGEIYNYIELRAELEGRGHVFKTKSDVEVLVHLYEEYGIDAIHRLNGMFAFCLKDRAKGLVWLARDRLGIKPLVYYQDDNLLAFGSTLDAIVACEGCPKELDEEAFFLYLTLAYIPTPRTVYKNIKKLKPGCSIVIENGRVKIQQYWEVPVGSFSELSHEDFVNRSREILKDSVALRSRSDVPVCSFLSGGIDSSAVTALYSEKTRQPVHTYSVDFEGKETSDLPFAHLMAERCKTSHHPYEIPAALAMDCLSELMPLMDEPMGDSAIIPSYYLAKMAREEGIKVGLSGAGGDELYGGYHRHFHRKKDYFIGQLSLFPRRIWLTLGAKIHPLLSHYGSLLHDTGINQALATSGVRLDVLQRVLKNYEDFKLSLSLLEDQFCELKELEAKVGFTYSRMIMDVKHYLLDNVLALFDKTTMATSLEGRVPLLDHRQLELVFSTRPHQNISPLEYKRSFKQAVKDYVPREILERPKTGFNAPVCDWFRGPMKEIVFNRLKNPLCPLIKNFCDPVYLQKVSDQEQAAVKGGEIFFLLYVFDLWYEGHF